MADNLDFLDSKELDDELQGIDDLAFLDDENMDQPPVEEVAPIKEEPMGKLQAAAVSADPLFINPQIGGLAAMAGEAVGRPSGVEASADKAIVKTEKAIEKFAKKDLTKKGNQKKLKGLQDNLAELKKLRNPSMRDTYYEGQQSTKDLEAKAFEDQPAASVAGMVGGGLMAPIPGAGIAKMGKVGKGLSKFLPSTDGIAKIAHKGKKAAKAEKLGLALAEKKLLAEKAKLTGKFALREGAKAGGLSAASRGDSKLFEGDIDGFVMDTAVGTGAGAVVGKVADSTMRATGKLITNSGWVKQLKKVYQEGTLNKTVDKDFIDKEIIDTTKKYVDTFKGKLKKTGANIGKLYDEMAEPGETLNPEEFVRRLRVVAENASPNDKAAMNKVLNVLDEFSLGGESDTKMIEQLEKKLLDKKLANTTSFKKAQIKQADKELKEAIEKQNAPVSRDDLGEVSSKDILPEGGPEVKANVSHQIFEEVDDAGQIVQRHKMGAEKLKEFKPSKIQQSVDPESGRKFAYSVDSASGDINRVIGDIKKETVEGLTPSDMHKLVVKLGKVNMRNADPNTTHEIRGVIGDIRKKLSSTIKDPSKKKELADLNKTYNALKNVEARIGLDANDSVKVSQNIEKVILGVGDKGDKFAYNNFLKEVKRVDPKLAQEIQAEIASLRFRSDISKYKEDYINSMSTNMTVGPKSAILALLGRIPTMINKGVNAIGKQKYALKSAVSDTAKKSKNYLANRTLDITQASPDDIQGMMKMIERSKNSADKNFLGPLKKAYESNSHRSKQTIMYGLSQQRAFIDTINSLQGSDEPQGE